MRPVILVQATFSAYVRLQTIGGEIWLDWIIEKGDNDPLQTICTTRTVADANTRNQMTDREKTLTALREKPLKVFDIMKRVNIKHQDDCQSLLLKMRDDGAVKFDIHKGHWLAA
jgi:hypothetical protein